MRLSGPLTADQEKQLTTILTSGKPLLPLIHDPLDVAKIESGTMGPSMETAMCRAVIDEIFSTPSHLAKAEGLEFETEARADEISVRSDRRACTDSAKLRQQRHEIHGKGQGHGPSQAAGGRTRAFTLGIPIQ